MKRLIARLDIKGENVIKGVHLEGLQIIGSAKDLSLKYASQDVDEIFFQDTVATLYQRNNLTKIIEEVSSNINIPLTVGGGIRSVADIEKILISGADKVSINTKFTEDKNSISTFSKKFGSQAIVGSIEAKYLNNDWIVFTDNGRNITNIKVLNWIKILQDEGVGEIIVTSIDKEGTKKGYDKELLSKVNEIIKVPLIVSGGIGNFEDINACFEKEKTTGVAVASIVHYNLTNFDDLKKKCKIKSKNIFKNINIKKNTNKVSILKTKICNFRSLFNSLKKICDVKVIDNFKSNNNERIIIPGVGSFPEIMKEFDKEKINFIQDSVKRGNPILGICLGAQILFSKGYEIKEIKGLDLIKGSTVSLKSIFDNKNLILPHTGWSEIKYKKHTIFQNIDNNSTFYFTHSYNFVPDDKKIIYAETSYSSCKINAVCIKENIIACQFHPEKSGNTGLIFLDNFSNLN